MTALDNYVASAPSHQNALDIFRDQWSSRFPPPWDSLKAGSIRLFEDSRTTWAIDQMGGVRGKTVLELGPLEGGHSYMLEKAEAGSVLSIEGNTSAFLRCLIAKEILGLQRVRFICGDFRQFFSTNQDPFDVVFASGVLYHMQQPVRLIRDICQRTQQIYFWTHYFDADLTARNAPLRSRLGPAQRSELDGFSYEFHSYSYNDALNWAGFCGGSAPMAAWLPRNSILGALRHFGFGNITIGFEQPDHPNGPAFAVVARRA